MRFWNKITPGIVVLGLASPAFINCNMAGLPGGLPGGLPAGIPKLGCPALEDGNFGQLDIKGGAEVKTQLVGFMQASMEYNKLVVKMESDLIASCGKLGLAAGMTEEEVKVEANNGEGAKKLCEAVATKVKALIDSKAGGQLTLEIGEPSCFVNIDGFAGCLKDCGSPIKPGSFEASCQGGKVSGTCGGECGGECVLDAGAQCSGTCDGRCEGKCDGKNSSGKCAGTCDGKCSGACTVKAKGKCSGRCTGGCSTELEAPKCSGKFVPPSADPSCLLGCGAKVATFLSCQPPSVIAKVDGKDPAPEIKKLISGIEAAIPAIITIQKGSAVAVKDAGKGLVTKVEGLGSVATKGGTQAISCLAQTGKMLGEATGAVDVQIEASVSVSASASGSASTK